MSVRADVIIPPAGASTQSFTGGQDVILIIVLCNFSVPFGKAFLKKVLLYYRAIQFWLEYKPFSENDRKNFFWTKALTRTPSAQCFCVVNCRSRRYFWTNKDSSTVSKVYGAISKIQFNY